MKINNAQKKFLRQSAHHLKPVVWVGQHGITEALINEIKEVLERHELVKVKCRLGERKERDIGILKICKGTNAALVQRISNIITLFKKNSEKPVIKLPN